MKHKTAELEGDALDYLVQCAERGEQPGASIAIWTAENDAGYQPSRHWDHGGPIIERERLSLSERPANSVMAKPYWAAKGPDAHPELYGSMFWSVGPTPLIAAMRAYVASRFGEEVELP